MRIAPAAFGVVAVVGFSLFIHLPDLRGGFLFRKLLALHLAADPVLKGCRDKDAQMGNAGLLQHVVGTASHEDAGAFGCGLVDPFALKLKYNVVGGHAPQAHFGYIVLRRIPPQAGLGLVSLLQYGTVDADVLCRVNQFTVIIWNIQIGSQASADVVAAAAIFPSNTDNHMYPSFDQFSNLFYYTIRAAFRQLGKRSGAAFSAGRFSWLPGAPAPPAAGKMEAVPAPAAPGGILLGKNLCLS